MTTLTDPPSRVAAIEREIDVARQRGPLQQIVVPPCPELLTRLQRTMAAAEPDLNEMGRIASADVAMAATLIRNANGALFAASGPPVASAGQALNRLGLRQSAALMTGFLARHALPVRSPQLEGFWDHSGQRALAMACIAQQLPGLSQDLSYSFGLFCHVGMPVMMQSVRGYAGTMAEGAARKDRSFVATENANHRTDHAVVGALTARAWHIAPAVVAAIRLHHSLESLGASDIDTDIHTLLAAGLVAEHLVRRHRALPVDADWTTHGDAAMDWLQVTPDDVQHWDDLLQPVLDGA
jgi:HD-like signal output (HDOD) protein